MSESIQPPHASIERLERRDVWLGRIVFCALLLSFGYFYQGGGWNENSRFDLVRALVDDHTLHIDPYHFNTGDKAYFAGHYYSDKAPGLSFVAAPVYLVMRAARGWFATEHDFVVAASYIVTLMTVGLATASTGWLLFRSSIRLGATLRGSTVVALAYGLGTIAFPLSTVLFGHQLAACLLFAAFYVAWTRPMGARRSPVAVATLAAAAVLVEFPTAPAALCVLAYHLWEATRRERVLTLVGVAVPALLLASYLALAFGSPWRAGYDLLANPSARLEMRTTGLFGITYPKIDVLFALLFGRFRGLVPYAPVLMIAAAGYFRMQNHARERNTAALVVAYFFLFASSYEWWHGGSSFGSRHLAPMLPFLILPLARVVDVRPKLAAVATAASIAFMTVATSVQPKPSERLPDPFYGAIWPAFVRGAVAANNLCPLTGTGVHSAAPIFSHPPRDAFNWGLLVGIGGQASLLPLLALWAAMGGVAWRLGDPKRERTNPSPE